MPDAGGDEVLPEHAIFRWLRSRPLSASAFADDAVSKKQLQQIGPTYTERFNKQDASSLAALYATGAITVDPAGPHTDIVKFYEGAFTAGINHAELGADQVWPWGSGAALGMGKYQATGNNPGVASMESADVTLPPTFVREGGIWEVRMPTTLPQAPAKQVRAGYLSSFATGRFTPRPSARTIARKAERIT